MWNPNGQSLASGHAISLADVGSSRAAR